MDNDFNRIADQGKSSTQCQLAHGTSKLIGGSAEEVHLIYPAIGHN